MFLFIFVAIMKPSVYIYFSFNKLFHGFRKKKTKYVQNKKFFNSYPEERNYVNKINNLQ